MKLPEIGSSVPIVCYKHNGSLHRTWGKSLVLSASENEIILANEKTQVRESSGRTWTTREPALCIFYPNRWYNIIVMMKDIGITYYVNVASPAVYDDNSLKYIDYDLDVKLLHDGKIKVLDRAEYDRHALKFGYPNDVKVAVEKQVEKIKQKMINKQEFFNHDNVYKTMKIWNKIKKG